MTITLYHCAHARSLRPLWCLEEMGLDYELVNLPFPPRYRAEGYKDINPLGTIPFLIDGDTRMSESTAICHYLVERHGPTDIAVASDAPEYGDYLNWLYFSDATLTFPQTLVLRYAMLEPEERRLPQASEDYAQWFSARLRHVEAALEGRDFLVADRFTIADIAIGYALHLSTRLPPLQGVLGPNAKTYLDHLRARPAFKICMEKQRLPKA